MEASVGGFLFFSNFDSGNLGRVEIVEVGGKRAADGEEGEDEDGGGDAKEGEVMGSSEEAEGASATTAAGNSHDDSTCEFNLWTRPDCEGTEFENGNRTWFYFGVRHCPTGSLQSSSLLRINFRNLNKQSKLFSQGMAPLTVSVALPKKSSPSASSKPLQPPLPQHSLRWERVRERPTYTTVDSNFVLTFRVRVEPKHVTYVAFTYPYSYRDLQSSLNRLEKKYLMSSDEEALRRPANSLYFHRELACLSYEGRRVDLLTVTSLHGITDEREDRLERSLFPESDKCRRPFKFENKKTIFVSARVHPGETSSSFVFNGFLKFLLREADPRAELLRRKYVFKLIPMLNPDGVFKGHYRTDCRGVNLNRVYSNPSMSIHPSIYAARKLVLYAHRKYEVVDEESEGLQPQKEQQHAAPDCKEPATPLTSRLLRSSEEERAGRMRDPSPATPKQPPPDGWYEMTETSRCSEGDESIADFSITNANRANLRAATPSATSFVDVESAKSLSRRTSFTGAFSAPRSQLGRPQQRFPEPPDLDGGDANLELPSASSFAKKLEDTIIAGDATGGSAAMPTGTETKSGSPDSGLFLYVDLHGHASKRGIFMYGNHFEETDAKVDSMLLPKLMSINCANFDFPACNFTQKNMFMKDRHTGAGREGSGRVSVFKATGLVRSYTLECNFNSGRVVNAVPAASRDGGRATPPPPTPADFPPKYDPLVYENSGKAMAISILDLTESNPWTRLTCSPCKTLKGVKDAIRKYIRQSEEQAKAKGKSGSNTASPARSTRSRRSRTVSASKHQGQKAVSLAAVAAALASKPAPSPDSSSSSTSRPPVTKIPRKGSISAKNSQGHVCSVATGGGGGGGSPASLESAAKLCKSDMSVLRRSKSISTGDGATVAKALALASRKKAGAAGGGGSGGARKLTRSHSASAPASRSSSPRRHMAGGSGQKRVSSLAGAAADSKVVKKRKKKTSVARSASLGAAISAMNAAAATTDGAATPNKKKNRKPKKAASFQGTNASKKRKISVGSSGGSKVN